MPSTSARRFLLEVLFLGGVAAALTFAELRPAAIIAVMAVAWVVVALLEWTAWLDEPHYGRGLPPRYYVPHVALPPPVGIQQGEPAYPILPAVDDEPTFVASTRRALSRAFVTISGVISTPMTRPLFPTRFAARKQSKPPPLPTRKPQTRITDASVTHLWKALAGGDAKAAYQARWLLSSVPQQTLPLLRAELQPATVDNKQIPAWIARLDSKSFKEREAATKALLDAGADGDRQHGELRGARPQDDG
jgi:hypothetical protein